MLNNNHLSQIVYEAMESMIYELIYRIALQS